MREVIRAVTLLGLRELVSDLGGDLEAYAREVAFDLTVTRTPDLFLSSRKVHELVNLAAERLKRKDLGLLWGARSDPARLGPLHVALVNAASGREALELIVRFLHINFPTGSVMLRPMAEGHREFIGVRSALVRPPSLIHFYERRVGSLHVLLKTVCGPAYRPDEVWFTHERQSSFAAYQNVFGIRPSFAMPENGIVVSGRVLDVARPATNKQVREMAVSFLKTHAPPANTSMTSEALHMIGILMRSSNCTSSQSARALGMHPRTFQRRLQKENASFEAIKDEVRCNMAREMLADPSMPLTSIAHHLYYANLSAFSRRCRTWFGKPPTLVRRGLLRRSKALHRAQIPRDL